MLYKRPPSHPSVSNPCGFLLRIHFRVSFGNNDPWQNGHLDISLFNHHLYVKNVAQKNDHFSHG
jgi:hypothetical protein